MDRVVLEADQGVV